MASKFEQVSIEKAMFVLMIWSVIIVGLDFCSELLHFFDGVRMREAVI